MNPRKSMLLAALALSLGCDPAPASAPEPREPARPEVTEPSASDELDDDGDGGACVPAPGPKAPAGRLMFVLDKSSSMGAGSRESAPALLGRPSRWAKAHALVSALAGRFEGEAELGASLFPSRYADVGGEAVQCDLLDIPDLPVGDHGADVLLARLPADEVDFAGGSPATLALRMAAKHLGDLPEGPPAAIVLVTDGGANCADEAAPLVQFDESLADVVAFTHDELHIPTFVVAAAPSSQEQAVPKIDPREALREIALAGGVPHPDDGYFDVADPEALAAAIAERFGIVEDETAANCP